MKIRAALILISGILIMINKNTYSQVLEQDSLALVAFYNSTGGQNWNNNSGWLTGPVSTWYGVTVQANRVKKIILNSNNLNGTLPPELGQLDVLVTFAVSHAANLIGEIPDELFQIDSLNELCIADCSITGPILNSIGNCLYLTELALCQNNLTGTIPPEIGNLTNLMFLNLYDNQLTGPIPPELGNCTNLLELHLRYNQLTGGIPENFINLFHSNYLTLTVGHNQLTEIPESWGNESFMACDLDLSWNDLTYLPSVNYNWLITFFRIEGNQLTFEHIEPHYQSYMAGLYYFFYYEPQDKMGTQIDTVLRLNSSYRIYSGTGGDYTHYEWYRNGEMILEGTDADTLYLENISYADTGTYTCRATSSLIYHLVLYRRPVHITLDTTINRVSNPLIMRNAIRCYPNPAGRMMTVIIPENDKLIGLKVFDMYGRCILSDDQIADVASQRTISLDGIPEGMYLLQAKGCKAEYYGKIIKASRGADW